MAKTSIEISQRVMKTSTLRVQISDLSFLCNFGLCYTPYLGMPCDKYGLRWCGSWYVASPFIAST